jgi:hypothetical protein
MDEGEETTGWQRFLPRTKGSLPNGSPIPRTDPSGSFEARIMFLGVYPAATDVRRAVVRGTAFVLPVAVEEESFAPASKSGQEFDEHYLRPLGLARRDVLVTDLVPYFLANTTKSTSGRSMADNVRMFEEATGRRTGIDVRPSPRELVRLARAMPGNLERLGEYARRCSPRLLFTLGTEAAAFIRGESYDAVERRVDQLFYADPAGTEALGVNVDVVHPPGRVRSRGLRSRSRPPPHCVCLGNVRGAILSTELPMPHRHRPADPIQHRLLRHRAARPRSARRGRVGDADVRGHAVERVASILSRMAWRGRSTR